LSATPERDALELAIVAPQGVALARLHGMAAPQAVAAFERTRVLCDALPINAERAWLMGRLGWVLFARGEYAATVALAARIHEWSLAHDDALLAACACCLTGVALSYQGQLQDAVRWMEQGLADCAGLEDRLAQAPFVVDPQVCMHGSLGRPLLLLGRTAEALVHAGAARTRAERIGQPMSELVARWCHGALEIALDRPEAVEEATAPLPALVERMASAPGEGPARWMRGWLEARHGDPDAGLADILEGLAHHKRYGMSAGCPQVLGYAADASFAAGDLPSALAQVDEGLALARRMDEGLSLPELTLQKAQLLQAGGRTVEACTLLRQTVDLAQRERAVRLELQALDALCATSRATPDELSALQRVRTIAAAIAAESAMA
ncbi:MAG: ATPase-like protein, partial [Rhizobacter sp.]|nr:ATPase-like protein [Rhizobacter sp.]